MEKITILILLAFLVITFLQSGLDKLIDWKGNLAFLTGHFSATFMKGMVPMLLAVILILEIAAGVLSIAGIVEVLWYQSTTWALYGACLSSVVLLMLLFGQRVAKDYDGARTIVIYLIPTIFTVFLLS
ncbi:DoxX family protein [Ascidiimonas aurantiaca]|uniref:DoxX family protein n=1 Tax=Ascidiimonas aurantiaca TaxID=1685432 RepID=UPI0030EC5CAE